MFWESIGTEKFIASKPNCTRILISAWSSPMLDYGASLWHSYTDFSEFITLIDKHIVKGGGGSLSQRIKELFVTDDAETEGLLASIRDNLSHGKFRFIVLMDKLHERLKDLVLFLNENSRFD